MKFTKEDAYKHLVGKMTPNKGQTLNMSERSINEMLDTLIPLIANDETELDSFIESVLPMFKTADLNVKNDVTGGIKKYQEENPKPSTTQSTPGNTNDAVVEEMRKRLEKMESEYNSRLEKERIESTRQQIIEKLKGKGVKDKEWVNSLLSEITITKDFDIDTKVESYLNLYNKIQAQFNPNLTPNGAGGTSQKDDETIKQAAAIAKQNRLVGEQE